MAVFSVYPLSAVLQLPSSSRTDPGNHQPHFSAPSLPHPRKIGDDGGNRSAGSRRFVALSTHSNPRILKSNRKSRFGQTLSPYDSDDEESMDFDEDQDDDEDEEDSFDDVSSSSSHHPCLCSLQREVKFEFSSPVRLGYKALQTKVNLAFFLNPWSCFYKVDNFKVLNCKDCVF